MTPEEQLAKILKQNQNIVFGKTIGTDADGNCTVQTGESSILARSGGQISAGDCVAMKADDGQWYAVSSRVTGTVSKRDIFKKRSRLGDVESDTSNLKILFLKDNELYVGGDRAEPERIYSGGDLNIQEASIINTGGSQEDFLVTVLATESGSFGFDYRIIVVDKGSVASDAVFPFPNPAAVTVYRTSKPINGVFQLFYTSASAIGDAFSTATYVFFDTLNDDSPQFASVSGGGGFYESGLLACPTVNGRTYLSRWSGNRNGEGYPTIGIGGEIISVSRDFRGSVTVDSYLVTSVYEVQLGAETLTPTNLKSILGGYYFSFNQLGDRIWAVLGEALTSNEFSVLSVVIEEPEATSTLEEGIPHLGFGSFEGLPSGVLLLDASFYSLGL